MGGKKPLSSTIVVDLQAPSDADIMQAALCQTCGNVGYEECLIFCSRCGISAEHFYCMARTLDLKNVVKWSCQECFVLSDVKEEVRSVASVYAPRKFLNSLDEKMVLNPVDEVEMLDSRQSQLTHWPSSDAVQKDCEAGQVIGNHKFSCSKKVVEGYVVVLDRYESEEEKKNEEEKKTVDIRIEMNHVDDSQRSALTEEARVIQNGQTCGNQDIRVIEDYKGYIYSEPVVDPVWGGYFAIDHCMYGKMVAHISSKACRRVYEETNKFPGVLFLEKHSRGKPWPSKFLDSQPTDDDIALYFFPETKGYAKLVDEINKRDLMLKATLDSSELLIFSSLLLPENYWRFNSEYYLWGVFRRRQCTLAV